MNLYYKQTDENTHRLFRSLVNVEGATLVPRSPERDETISIVDGEAVYTKTVETVVKTPIELLTEALIDFKNGDTTKLDAIEREINIKARATDA